MTTIAIALAEARNRLAATGLAGAALDARVLIAAALGCERLELLRRGDALLSQAQRAAIEALIARRAAGEPVGRILGRREFWGLDFTLSPATLEPRPDSEVLVETALATLSGRMAPLRVLDLGTGTGCLLLAALSELPQARGIGVDRSALAAATARGNAQSLGLAHRAHFLVGDWATAIAGRFDLLLCNPPYIAESETEALSREVRGHDPAAALFAGADGLAAYRALLPNLAAGLAPGGRAVLEIGAGQGDAVIALAEQAGLRLDARHRDLGGVERCLHFVAAG